MKKSKFKGKIVSEINQFYCKNCKRVSNIVYKYYGLSFCDECIPDNVKKECKEFKH